MSEIVVDILQFKQVILPSQVQVDKSVSGAARLHRSRLLYDLTLLLPSWLGPHPEPHTICWSGSKSLVCPYPASAHTPATTSRTSSWHHASQIYSHSVDGSTAVH